MKRDVYQIITDRIVDLLAKGTVPWQKPWGGKEQHPRSLVSGRNYRGINTFLLSQAGYESPYWLTYKQARDRDGHVRKGEKGYPCIYWNWFEKENAKTGDVERIPFLKYYTVFNAEQCDDIAYPAVERLATAHSPIEGCEAVVSDMPNPPMIDHGGFRACYDPKTDRIRVPRRENFHSPESYYATLFHEMVHSTGHASRLARSGVVNEGKFGADPYCREELVAEMGAAFLAGHTGIESKVIDNSAAYIDHWLSRLEEDNRLVVTAGAQAQKAADYILDCKGDGRSPR